MPSGQPECSHQVLKKKTLFKFWLETNELKRQPSGSCCGSTTSAALGPASGAGDWDAAWCAIRRVRASEWNDWTVCALAAAQSRDQDHLPKKKV